MVLLFASIMVCRNDWLSLASWKTFFRVIARSFMPESVATGKFLTWKPILSSTNSLRCGMAPKSFGSHREGSKVILERLRSSVSF
jgi:hypothetical protein